MINLYWNMGLMFHNDLIMNQLVLFTYFKMADGYIYCLDVIYLANAKK